MLIKSHSQGLRRAALGEIDGTQCHVPRHFATLVWVRAAMARGGRKPPRRIRRMHVARRKKIHPGVSRQRRSDRRPDEIGPPELLI